jgi:phage shock protein PspC (stress-responsive transcriptional regulator)
MSGSFDLSEELPSLIRVSFALIDLVQSVVLSTNAYITIVLIYDPKPLEITV